MWELDLEDIEKGGRLIEFKTVGERKAIGDKTAFHKGDILYSKLRPYLLKILVAPADGICTPEIVPFSMFGDIDAEYIVTSPSATISAMDTQRKTGLSQYSDSFRGGVLPIE